jgi:hypothetical protein
VRLTASISAGGRDAFQVILRSGLIGVRLRPCRHPVQPERLNTEFHHRVETKHDDLLEQIILLLRHPFPHLRGQQSVVRLKTHRFRVFIIQIFDNDVRLNNRLSVIDQRRHDAMRVEREVFRQIVIELPGPQKVLRPAEFFLGQDDAHFHTAGRIPELV